MSPFSSHFPICLTIFKSSKNCSFSWKQIRENVLFDNLAASANTYASLVNLAKFFEESQLERAQGYYRQGLETAKQSQSPALEIDSTRNLGLALHKGGIQDQFRPNQRSVGIPTKEFGLGNRTQSFSGTIFG